VTDADLVRPGALDPQLLAAVSRIIADPQPGAIDEIFRTVPFGLPQPPFSDRTEAQADGGGLRRYLDLRRGFIDDGDRFRLGLGHRGGSDDYFRLRLGLSWGCRCDDGLRFGLGDGGSRFRLGLGHRSGSDDYFRLRLGLSWGCRCYDRLRFGLGDRFRLCSGGLRFRLRKVLLRNVAGFQVAARHRFAAGYPRTLLIVLSPIAALDVHETNRIRGAVMRNDVFPAV
jgi:hypothetical protein